MRPPRLALDWSHVITTSAPHPQAKRSPKRHRPTGEPPSGPSRTEGGSVEPSTILIVDDDEIARVTLERLLTTEPCQLAFAVNGAEALDRLSAQTIDLVLCDALMPTIDGYEVCQRIKAHETWKFVPVILISALDGKDDVVRGIEAGADEFIAKPIDRLLLRARVRAMLRIRRQYLQLRDFTPAPPPGDLESLLVRRREQLVVEAKLSARERQVLELLLLGRNHQDIAKVLGISERTSKFHQRNLLAKLGADSRADLMRLFL